MDFEVFVLAIGFILSGFIIGYPIGHIFGKREAAGRYLRKKQFTFVWSGPGRQPRNYGVLNDEILEDRSDVRRK